VLALKVISTMEFLKSARNVKLNAKLVKVKPIIALAAYKIEISITSVNAMMDYMKLKVYPNVKNVTTNVKLVKMKPFNVYYVQEIELTLLYVSVPQPNTMIKSAHFAK
jgi:hypothetical protein